MLRLTFLCINMMIAHASFYQKCKEFYCSNIPFAHELLHCEKINRPMIHKQNITEKMMIKESYCNVTESVRCNTFKHNHDNITHCHNVSSCIQKHKENIKTDTSQGEKADTIEGGRTDTSKSAKTDTNESAKNYTSELVDVSENVRTK